MSLVQTTQVVAFADTFDTMLTFVNSVSFLKHSDQFVDLFTLMTTRIAIIDTNGVVCVRACVRACMRACVSVSTCCIKHK